MSVDSFDFTKRLGNKRIIEFASILNALSGEIGFKVSSRGWAYIMEQRGYINKNQFDKVADAINRCRKEGLLPVDFVAEDVSRGFQGVETTSDSRGESMQDVLAWMVRNVLEGSKYYTPDWWDGEEYYIQMVVEKVDLVSLFEPVCRKYHIPIANARGWSSILQRADYARRFKEASDMGLKCVLLYCGDHDPDGLRISDTLRSNLQDVSRIHWGDGEIGYDPTELIIDRFGLNYDFIIENDFTWIDNLITGNTQKKMDLSDSKHPNHTLQYVQEYLRDVGARKCEANVIVTMPTVARAMCAEAIQKYVGMEALQRFRLKEVARAEEYEGLLVKYDIYDPIRQILDDMNK